MAGGRPTKLTPDLQDELVRVLRVGNYAETACAYVGLNKTTFYDWMKRGARAQDKLKKDPDAEIPHGEEIYIEFSNAIKKAEADAEARDVLIIGKAAESQWQAAAWRLERKFPEKWGRRGKRDAEEQEARIAKLEAETEKLKAETRTATQSDEDANQPVTNFMEALAGAVDTEGIYDDPATE